MVTFVLRRIAVFPKALPRWSVLTLAALMIVSSLVCSASQAQTRLRWGAGFQISGHTSEGVGLGLRGRVAIPVKSDLSVAFGTAVVGHVFKGRDDAVYVMDPQFSVIVTLPGERRVPYFMAGMGAYLPLSESASSDAAPFFHAGFGWVWSLQESTLFLEFNPALSIEKSSIAGIFPLRAGLIF